MNVRRIIAVFALAGAAGAVALATPAHAEPPVAAPPTVVAQQATDYGVNPVSISSTSPSQFALVADCPGTSARSRQDFSGFDVSQLGAKVDATDIWHRSLDLNNNQKTWQPDRVQIWLRFLDENQRVGYEVWTARGGGLGDGASVPSSYHWDPSGSFNGAHKHTGIHAETRTLGGVDCTSPWVGVS